MQPARLMILQKHSMVTIQSLLVVGLLALAPASGCRRDESREIAPTGPTAGEPGVDQEPGVQDDVGADMDQAPGEPAALPEDLSADAARLRDMEAKIAELEARLEEERSATLSDEARQRIDQALEEVREARRVAQSVLDETQRAGQESWGELRQGMRQALDRVQEAYGRAQSASE